MTYNVFGGTLNLNQSISPYLWIDLLNGVHVCVCVVERCDYRGQENWKCGGDSCRQY